MNRTDVAYVINSTPKYYYLLKAHLTLLRRYAPDLCWPVYIGSEEPNNNTILSIAKEFNATIIVLDKNKYEDSFWESRIATVSKLPDGIRYIFPVQEDFLLERPGMNATHFKNVLSEMDQNSLVVSARVMPCPGPNNVDTFIDGWSVLGEYDTYLFTFQATLWKKHEYVQYLSSIVEYSKKRFINIKYGSSSWNKMAININIAENEEGCLIFKKIFAHTIHLAYIRSNMRANAVYDCPFPYRPTAIVKGVLQDWAKELMQRESIEYFETRD